MQLSTTRHFISAVAAVGDNVLGTDHPLLDLIESTERSFAPEAFSEIQNAIDALPEETRESLFKAVHEHMRGDLSLIWDQLPAAQNKNTH
jgi:hypothetical protein